MRFRQEVTLHIINSFGATNVRIRITQVMLLLFYLLQLLQYGLRYIGIQFVQIQPSLHL